MEFQSFYIRHTQGEVNHEDGRVHEPSDLDDLLGVSNTSMDVLCHWGDRPKCLHASAAVVQRHRPSHVLGTAPARVRTLGLYGQAVPDYVWQLCVPVRLFRSVRLVSCKE